MKNSSVTIPIARQLIEVSGEFARTGGVLAAVWVESLDPIASDRLPRPLCACPTPQPRGHAPLLYAHGRF